MDERSLLFGPKAWRRSLRGLLSCTSLLALGCGAQHGSTSESNEVRIQQAQSSLPDYTDTQQWSRNPPDDLVPADVPQFVAVTFDDNFVPAGMTWATAFLRPLRNREADGIAGTFDGAPVRTSFYFTSQYIDTGNANRQANREAWATAVEDGHEAANHTLTHPDGSAFSVQQWTNEIIACTNLLTHPDPNFGIGVQEDDLLGFRAPFLLRNDNMYTALKNEQLAYDSSIQSCWNDGENGTNCAWPHTLDEGSPDADVLTMKFDEPVTNAHPGLWELPATALIIPPDSEAEAYDFEPGLRGRIPADLLPTSYFEADTGKIAPLDITLFVNAGMKAGEVLATLKHTLDLHLEGNRSPFVFVAHTHVYDESYDLARPLGLNSLAEERRAAIEEFVAYALSKDAVRMVPVRDMLAWMRNPVPLTGERSVDPGAGGAAGANGGGGTGSGGGDESGDGGCACRLSAPGSDGEQPALGLLLAVGVWVLHRARRRALRAQGLRA